MTEKYRFVGSKVPRRDARDIVTGKTKYLNDLSFVDLLYGKVLRSPHAHALIKDVDTSKAKKLPGVHAVLTWEDNPGWKGGMPVLTPVLDKKVRFVGDAVALVAADTEKIAEEALRLIAVEYEKLDAVYDAEAALEANAPQLYDEIPGNSVPLLFADLGPRGLKGLFLGDCQKGFAEADVVAEGSFAYEGIPNPIPPEPPGAIATWEEPNKVNLWVASQAPYFDGFILSDVTGRSLDIRIHGNPCGGSYGSKRMSWQVHAYAVLLARATGKPVKVYLTKEEHMATFTVRPGSRISARVGMKKDGTVTAISGNWLINTGYHSTITQAQVIIGCGEAMLAVKCANWNLKPTIACTNRTASGMVRGFGGQELKCVLIPILSLAMAKADLDPFEVLKKSFIRPGDKFLWHKDDMEQTYRAVDYSRSMDAGAERFGWKDRWKGWLTPSSVDGRKRRGIGVGIHGNADIGEDPHEAYIRLNPTTGTATIISTLVEHGTGQISNYIKMAAEILQLPVEQVSISESDSMYAPFDFGPAGSRGTYAIGSAIIAAAEDARKKLLEMAAPVLGCTPDDIDMEDAMVYVKNMPEKRIPWVALGWNRTITGFGRFEEDYTMSNCMTSFVEVEVDTETGMVDLVRVVNATDAGKIIDPQGLEGQLNGCLGAAGIDSALFEETIIDNKGRVLNANLIDYKWRTSADLPPIENVILETPAPSHRFRAVGVGEISTSPGPSAVLMAVSNAIGVWIHDYPITPDKVLQALETKKTQEVHS
jgi:CO/xanthine dehydrogenase Mo-binding subunit